MKKICIKKAFEIRYGMKAPKLYIRFFDFVVMWWGWRNGKLEFRKD